MKDPLIGFPAHWAPNDLEFYLLGRMEGRRSDDKQGSDNTTLTASPEAKRYGHEL